MAFVELSDRSGAAVLVNPLGVVYLRASPGGETELHLNGRAEPLVVTGAPADVAKSLENAAPTPPDPTLSLLA